VPSTHFGALSSANLLDVLGVQPMLGRWFTAAEDRPGRPLMIVLSHAVWRDEFGSDPGVLGRALNANGEPGTVIGVMPPRFGFPTTEQVWTNLRAAPGDPRLRLADRVEMVGKLKPGVTPTRRAPSSICWPPDGEDVAGDQQGPRPDEHREVRTRLCWRRHAVHLYLMLAMTLFSSSCSPA